MTYFFVRRNVGAYVTTTSDYCKGKRNSCLGGPSLRESPKLKNQLFFFLLKMSKNCSYKNVSGTTNWLFASSTPHRFSRPCIIEKRIQAFKYEPSPVMYRNAYTLNSKQPPLEDHEITC